MDTRYKSIVSVYFSTTKKLIKWQKYFGREKNPYGNKISDILESIKDEKYISYSENVIYYPKFYLLY